MSLTTYNFFWSMIEFILPRYLERRQKKEKKIFEELMSAMEFQKKIDQMALLFGYMAQVLVSLLRL